MVQSSTAFSRKFAMRPYRLCRWTSQVQMDRLRRVEIQNESSCQTAHWVFGIRSCAGCAGRMERLAVARDGQGVAANCRAELRFGGRRAGDEGIARTAGLGLALWIARRGRARPSAARREP